MSSRRLALISIALSLGLMGNLTFGGSILTFIVDVTVITLAGILVFSVYAYITFLPVLLAGLNMPTAELTSTLILAPLFYTCLAYIISSLTVKPLLQRRIGGWKK